MGAAIFNAQAPGGIWSQCTACGTVLDGPSSEWLFCLDTGDGEFGGLGRGRGRGRSGGSGASPQQQSEPSGKARGGRRRKAKDGSKSTPRPEVNEQRLEELTKELFDIHDLNRNGLLEEEELVSLNERIARLHHGKDFDTTEVRETYRALFREKLDPQGRPVVYKVFRAYAREVLDGVDDDPEAQEMILEQFVAEAQSGAALLDTNSVKAADEANDEDPFGEEINDPFLSAAKAADSIGEALAAATTAESAEAGIGMETPLPDSEADTEAFPSQPDHVGEASQASSSEAALPTQPTCMPRVPRCSSDSSMDENDFSQDGDGSVMLRIHDAEQRSVRRASPRLGGVPLEAPCPPPLVACRASATPQPATSGKLAQEPRTPLVC